MPGLRDHAPGFLRSETLVKAEHRAHCAAAGAARKLLKRPIRQSAGKVFTILHTDPERTPSHQSPSEQTSLTHRRRPRRLHFCNCSRETLQFRTGSPDCTSATLHERHCNLRALGAPEPKCSQETGALPRPIGGGLAHDSVTPRVRKSNPCTRLPHHHQSLPVMAPGEDRPRARPCVDRPPDPLRHVLGRRRPCRRPSHSSLMPDAPSPSCSPPTPRSLSASGTAQSYSIAHAATPSLLLHTVPHPAAVRLPSSWAHVIGGPRAPPSRSAYPWRVFARSHRTAGSAKCHYPPLAMSPAPGT